MNWKKDLMTIGGLMLAVVALLVFGRASGNLPTNTFETATPSGQITTSALPVKINNNDFRVEIADSSDERSKGLSKRDSIAPNSGMLFVFDKEEAHGFWMKDTNFPLDIIWISKDKKIVDIAYAVVEPGVKDSDLTVYKPSSNAQFVLELAGGTVNSKGILIGQAVEFAL